MRGMLTPDFQLQRNPAFIRIIPGILLLLCCRRKVEVLQLFVEEMDKNNFWRGSFGFGKTNKQIFLPADLVWICDLQEGLGLLCFC